MELDKLAEHAQTCLSRNQLPEAVTALEKICLIAPQLTEPRYKLAVILDKLGENKQSVEHLQELVKLHNDHVDALVMLSRLYIVGGNPQDALPHCRHVLEIDPSNTPVLLNAGVAYSEIGLLDEAQTMLEQAVKKLPSDAHTHIHLARVYMRKQKHQLAEAMFLRAREIEPELVPASVGYGNALLRQGRYGEAECIFMDLYQKNQHNAVLLNQIGNMYRSATRLDSAFKYFKLALSVIPDSAEIRNNLGNVLLSQGQHAEAIRYYEEAVKIKPDFWQAHSNLVFLMNYLPGTSGNKLLNAHRQWANQQTADITRFTTWQNSRRTDRPLRIAYLSPDFHHHPVSYFIRPILANHKPERVITVCLSDSLKSDSTTGQLQELAAEWHVISKLEDNQVAELIRENEIDILVDLAGHTNQHRLGVFARKPAPVQVNYLGYPATSGLKEMDYRITDKWADPSEDSASYHTEELVYIPSGFLCYEPDRTSPEVAPLPAEENGFVTFGSLNNLSKINNTVISTWASILNVLPGSRIIIKNHALTDPNTREKYIQLFGANGIKRERIDLRSHVQRYTEHLATYGEIDIGLDTFPYNGTTTTCESLWMGVPVVVLNGHLHAGRVGNSLLSRVKLPGLIACNLDQYKEVAVNLAMDKKQLRLIRNGMRDRVMQSPLFDGSGFTHELEAIYFKMWRKWVSGNHQP